MMIDRYKHLLSECIRDADESVCAIQAVKREQPNSTTVVNNKENLNVSFNF